jgi:hypothetical protein
MLFQRLFGSPIQIELGWKSFLRGCGLPLFRVPIGSARWTLPSGENLAFYMHESRRKVMSQKMLDEEFGLRGGKRDRDQVLIQVRGGEREEYYLNHRPPSCHDQ